MPSYNAPGVYVGETTASRSIDGQDTGATAFLGMTTWGASEGASPPMSSFGEYQEFFGPCSDLRLGGEAATNHVAYAARAFFENGGSRLRVVRLVGAKAKRAQWTSADPAIGLVALTAGGATIDGSDANFRVTFTILRRSVTQAQALQQPAGTLIETSDLSCLIDSGSVDAALAALAGDELVKRVSLRVAIEAPGGFVRTFDDLAFDSRHPRALQSVFAETSGEALVRFVLGETVVPADLRDVLEATGAALMSGGSDGDGAPSEADWKVGIDRLRALDDVSLVAAPGSSSFPGETPTTVAAALIALAEEPGGFRFAVLDLPDGLSPAEVTDFAAPFDTKNAALYYPWILSAGTAEAPIALPPSGFVCGIYRRSEIERGMWKAPGNETVSSAVGLTATITARQQELLNPQGINCVRAFPGRGIRVFGARTLTSDPEWKYVSQSRYFQHLHRSIERGVAWAVFERSDPSIWAALATSVSDFLVREWQSGALPAAKADDAFYVRCDRSTMTQSEVDNGIVVIQIGLALVRPAEFVTMRIDIPAMGQGA